MRSSGSERLRGASDRIAPLNLESSCARALPNWRATAPPANARRDWSADRGSHAHEQHEFGDCIAGSSSTNSAIAPPATAPRTTAWWQGGANRYRNEGTLAMFYQLQQPRYAHENSPYIWLTSVHFTMETHALVTTARVQCCCALRWLATKTH